MPYFIVLTCYQINDTNGTLNYSGTPLIRSPMRQKNLAVLMGDRINEGFFTIKCMVGLPGGQKKVPLIARCPYHRGGRKAGSTVETNTKEDKLCRNEKKFSKPSSSSQAVLESDVPAGSSEFLP